MDVAIGWFVAIWIMLTAAVCLTYTVIVVVEGVMALGGWLRRQLKAAAVEVGLLLRALFDVIRGR
jgi:hypothetical protein